jgi:HJR/Mrr/RecB family endonuclease
LKLRNGTVYWVCICSEAHTGSTFCFNCSHRPSDLKAVSRTKRFWITQGRFEKICLRLSRRDAKRKLDTILRANDIFFRSRNDSLQENQASRVSELRYRNIKSHYFNEVSSNEVAQGDETSKSADDFPTSDNPQKHQSPDRYRELKSHYFHSITPERVVKPTKLTNSAKSTQDGQTTRPDDPQNSRNLTGDVHESPQVSVAATGKSRAPDKPAPALELDPTNFEWYCAEWCVYFGHRNVRVTRSSKDGGIDVHGDGFIAQVKLQELPVGVKAIRELAGLVSIRSKAIGYFFTINGYSAQALAEANELGLAIFIVRPFQAEIIPKSELAALIVEDAKLAYG